MKRAIIIVAASATVHFALMWFTTAKTIDHSLSQTLTFLGTSPSDTWLTDLTSRTSSVLRQPVDGLLDLFPQYSEPKAETTTDQILGWSLNALNSILWGVIIWLIWHGFRRYRLHRLQVA